MNSRGNGVRWLTFKTKIDRQFNLMEWQQKEANSICFWYGWNESDQVEAKCGFGNCDSNERRKKQTIEQTEREKRKRKQKITTQLCVGNYFLEMFISSTLNSNVLWWYSVVHHGVSLHVYTVLLGTNSTWCWSNCRLAFVLRAPSVDLFHMVHFYSTEQSTKYSFLGAGIVGFTLRKPL